MVSGIGADVHVGKLEDRSGRRIVDGAPGVISEHLHSHFAVAVILLELFDVKFISFFLLPFLNFSKAVLEFSFGLYR